MWKSHCNSGKKKNLKGTILLFLFVNLLGLPPSQSCLPTSGKAVSILYPRISSWTILSLPWLASFKIWEDDRRNTFLLKYVTKMLILWSRNKDMMTLKQIFYELNQCFSLKAKLLTPGRHLTFMEGEMGKTLAEYLPPNLEGIFHLSPPQEHQLLHASELSGSIHQAQVQLHRLMHLLGYQLDEWFCLLKE